MVKWFPSFRRGSAAVAVDDAPSPRAPDAAPASEEKSAVSESPDDLVGKKLNGTYVIDTVLGEGGMGRVYRARHTRILSKEFAIKVLRPEFARNAEVVQRFRREAEAAACISHPNVVGVYDVDQTPDGHSYLVCEYLKGADLADEIHKGGPLEVSAAVHVAVQACRALEAAHARGVVHRDLKPHNVFLIADADGEISPRPAVKLLDFGLSRFVDAPGTQLTQTGVIMGTPAYMAPEQADGTGVDVRTDVYGLGAVLFTALCGRPPFEADTLQAVVLAVLTQEAPRARTYNPNIPENLELVLQKAMSRKREERYQSMTELRRALEPFIVTDQLELLEDETGSRPKQSSRSLLEADARAVGTARPRLALYGALAFALLIAGLGSLLPAVELITGKLTFTQAEVALFLLAIIGTLATPSLLLLRRLKKTVWGSHARVMDLLESVRGVVLAAILSYGFSALLVRFFDDVVGRMSGSTFFVSTRGSGWAGWNLLFLVVALVMGGVTGARIGINRKSGSGIVRRVTPILTLSGVFVSGLVLYAGFMWRAHEERTQPAKEKPVVAPKPAPPPAPPKPDVAARLAALPKPAPPPPPAAPQSVGAPVPPPPPPPARAPSDELAAAVAKGADGLLPLAEKYPNDPAVLKPLVIAFASRSTGLADAMVVATRLFDAAPEQAADEDLRFLVKKAAGTPGDTSKLAFAALTGHMGSAGPDLLYELMLNDAKTSQQARELLATPDVRGRASPALLVAYDLRLASTCSAKVPLLPRAAELGDERTISILSPLATGRPKGCGKRKRDPCPPPCAEEAKRFNETLARIGARGAAARR
jgi:serine/threonine-protein kinase